MPTIPSTLYQFDTNKTHVVTPTSGHMSDGWASDEIIGSGELNGFTANWSDWLKLVSDSVTATIVAPIDLNAATHGSAGTPVWTTSGSTRYWFLSTDGWEINMTLHLPAGCSLTDLVVGYRNVSPNPFSVTVESYSDAGAATTIVTKQDTSHTGSDTTMSLASSPSAGSLPATIASGTTYRLRVIANANDRIYVARASYVRSAL